MCVLLVLHGECAVDTERMRPLGTSVHCMVDILIMPAVHDVAAIDLNLVRLLSALLDEQHLTRAGKRLALTQSATSHALRRLRRLCGDPLFVRTSRGLAPTARAQELAEPVREAMRALERCFRAEKPFVAASAVRSFSIATSDYGSFVLAPRLLARLGREAPDVDLWFRTVDASLEEQLARGDADVGVVPTRRDELPVGIRSRPLYRERFVCLVRKGHPLLKKRIDLASWTSMHHVFIAPRGTPGGVVDETLAQLGKRRRVALAVPHFLLAPHVVAGSDLVVTVGARVAEAFAEILPLRVVHPPVKLPGFEVRMYWHERHHRDPAQQWFRDAVRGAAETSSVSA
jgi:DNA-binding transcriptional LysR family regulator